MSRTAAPATRTPATRAPTTRAPATRTSATLKREPLTRERILAVAAEIAAAEGVEALSMRRVAAELGTGAMTLYNHVADKDALLAGVAERALDQVEVTRGVVWTEMVTRWAESVRAVMLDAGLMAPILASPQRGLLLLAAGITLVDALADDGMERDEAAEVARIVARYVVGSVMIDGAHGRRQLRERAELDATFVAGLDALVRGLALQRPT